MKRLLLPLLLTALCACSAGSRRAAAARGPVLAGIDTLQAEGFRTLRGKRVGLITNQTGKDRSGRTSIEVLANAPDVELVALFEPEHGLSGTLEEWQVSSGTAQGPAPAKRYKLQDGRELPLLSSLYSPQLARAPTPDILAQVNLDALVFDIQDIGARFYTYSASMGIAMEAAAKAGVPFVVLDRPNPITGTVIEGPILDKSVKHITAYFPIPVRHGLTMGEIARLHKSVAGLSTDLTVVPLKNWRRASWYDETGLPWTRPSPNMPDVDAASLYPGIGIFESANLSVGRGTPVPFRWVGAPWLDADAVVARVAGQVDGVEFSVQDYTPTKSSYRDYMGQACRGIRITVTDRDIMRPLSVFLHLALALREIHPREFSFRWDEAKRMVGTDEFRRLWETGAGMDAFRALFDKGPAEFERSRRSVLLY